MPSNFENYHYQQEVTPEIFAHMTDWLLAWQQRNKGMEFSLVLIEFEDIAALGNTLGAAFAMDLIRRVGREISNVLRTTDLFCRIRTASFLVLLPQGVPNIVLNKIEPIIAAARLDGLDASKLHIGRLTLPEELKGEASAVALFERLSRRKN